MGGARIREVAMAAPEPDFDDPMMRARIELWAARDAVIGAEAAAGRLRARVMELEAALDDRNRHVSALLDEVVELRKVETHRDALLRSPTWKAGVTVMRPVQWVRRGTRRPP
jgi:hypothetical protein